MDMFTLFSYCADYNFSSHMSIIGYHNTKLCQRHTHTHFIGETGQSIPPIEVENRVNRWTLDSGHSRVLEFFSPINDSVFGGD